MQRLEMCVNLRVDSRLYGINVERYCDPPVCLSRYSSAAAACGGFAAERRSGRTYRSTPAGADLQQQRRRSMALGNVDSRVDEAEHRLVSASCTTTAYTR